MERILKRSIFPLCLLVAGLFVLEIMYTNDLAGSGHDIREYDQKIDAMRAENQELSQEVASASALTAVRERALTQGLTETKTVLTMSSETFAVAMNQ